MKSPIFKEADILLPDFSPSDTAAWRKWAVIACDQFTSNLPYWDAVESEVGCAPSTLRMFLPEAYLSRGTSGEPEKIRAAMDEYSRGVLKNYPASMIYLERTFASGKIRAGIVGAFDLDAYDYKAGSKAKIRATEGTVLSRVPPRVEIRRNAPLEVPHVMVFLDDKKRAVIEPLHDKFKDRAPLYSFELMQDGGSVSGWLMSGGDVDAVKASLADIEAGDFPYAVGDGNHSLAAAKAYREELRATMSEAEAENHPSRYALAELVNLESDAIVFEPIYRLVTDCDTADLTAALKKAGGGTSAQKVVCVFSGGECELTFAKPTNQLTVGTLQNFLDDYAAAHPEVTVTYIHGEDETRELAMRENCVGFIFDGMDKGGLFPYVAANGALPRKTFSMGDAREKRYYIESRRIK